MITRYPQEIESQMQELYKRLGEKSSRLYAAVESSKLGHGGVSYIARLFGCSRNTILRGVSELDEDETLDSGRDRKPGGGRSAILDAQPEIHDVFLKIIKEHTAGDPMNAQVKWTNLTRAQIGKLLAKQGFTVSRNIVGKLLARHGYVKRKALKKSRRRTCES